MVSVLQAVKRHLNSCQHLKSQCSLVASKDFQFKSSTRKAVSTVTMASTNPGSQTNEAQADANLTYKDKLDETAHKTKYGSQDNENDGGIVNQVAEKGDCTCLQNFVYDH